MPWLLNLVYVALLAAVSPLLLYRRLRLGKYRDGWAEKFWGELPERTSSRPCVWLHAVSVGEVLQLQRRWITLHPTETYRQIGIRSFGRGIFHKAPVQGSALGNKRVLRIEPGDLVFNNVFAWEGAVGVAGKEETGKIGSHRFVTYTVNQTRSTSEYLKLYLEDRRRGSETTDGTRKPEILTDESPLITASNTAAPRPITRAATGASSRASR